MSEPTDKAEVKEIVVEPAAVLESESEPKPEVEEDPWYTNIENDKIVQAKSQITKRITEIVARYKLDNFQVLILFDEDRSISNFDANSLYTAASKAKVKKDILLIIHSNGGSIEPAYLIGKTLKRLAKDKFVVAVPRKAKSAATLIALGADEIHMGLLSQLGPIDPQIGSLPALALGNALESIAEMVSKHEKSSEMFAKYLSAEVPIRLLGYFNRIGESAIQYAERLIGKKTLGGGMNASELAKHLVNYYKDHGFVIDIDEAKSLLGEHILKSNTEIYRAADAIFNVLDFVRLMCEKHDKTYWYVGEVADGPTVLSK